MNRNNLCFLAEPDRYGRFGHQSFSLLSSWCFAHRFKAMFIPNNYAYFAEKYNEWVDFSRSKYSFNGFTSTSPHYKRLKGVKPDNVGNTKYSLCNQESINAFCADLTSLRSFMRDGLCLHLPFDQTAGVLMHSLTRTMHADLQKIFHKLICSHKSIRSFHIVIHVRRGDVNSSSHPQWYVNDSLYAALIEALFRCYGDMIAITVLIQGVIDLGPSDTIHYYSLSGNLRINSTFQEWINDNEIRDFSTMINADLLISGQSSFSQLAALIKNGRVPVCVVKNEASRLPHPVDVDDLVIAEKDLLNVDSAEYTIRTKLAKHIPVSYTLQ